MKQSRIALVVSEFPARSETFIVSKALGLIEAGWDVHIVCQSKNQKSLLELPQSVRRALTGRVHVAWPHRPKALAAMLSPVAVLWCLIRRPIRTLSYLWRGGGLRRLYLDAQLVRLAPNVINFEFGTLAVGRMHIGAALNTSTIVSFRGYDLNRIALEDPNYYLEVWEKATAVHVLGHHLWERAQERGCPAKKPHALISPAINLEFYDPGDRESPIVAGTIERPLRILSVGRLEWTKGYEYGIEAIRTLSDRGVWCQYHIVGAGDFYTATAYARYQLGVTDSVDLLGSRTPKEVREEMLWADVFLHAAVSEGFGNAVIEAQAMKLPVVCTSAGGLRENVADGETGIIVPARDPDALADALATLAHDASLRERLGVAGRARAHARFRLEDQVAAFSALYERAGARRVWDAAPMAR